MKCPKCATSDLNVSMIAELAVQRDEMPSLCSSCGGMWVPGYAALKSIFEDISWRPEIRPKAEDYLENEKRTGKCPAGHGLLIRAKVYDEPPYYLEKCFQCGGYWFDFGEWERLLSSEHRTHLQELWCDAWQERMRRQQSEQLEERLLIDRLGAELFAELKAIGARLAAHPHRNQALAYLQGRLARR